MDKGKIEAMVTKFSEKFAIIMLKKHRKFCRRGLTHFDATPIFKKSFRYIWVTLYCDLYSQYVHKGAELFKGGNYLRKFGIYKR